MKIVVDGRTYDMPMNLTFRELGLVKRVSGVRSAEINEALEAGDTDVIAALIIIAMRRSGQDVKEDHVLSMDIGSVDIAPDEPEEEGPPTGPAGGDVAPA